LARIAWVDRTKGWGMIAIMAGHGDIPFRLALSFVPVPVFFFFSGYLFREDKYRTFFKFLKARTRTLLIPYLLFAIANCGVWLVFHPADRAQGWLASLRPLTKQIIAVRRDGEDPYLGPYWFILCLFVTQLMYYLVENVGDLFARHSSWSSLRWRTLIISVLTVAGFVYVRHGSHWLPWSLDVSLIAIAFYGAEHVARLHPRFDALLVDGVLSAQRIDPIVPHPHLLHALVARLIKGSVGTVVTAAGLVLAYVLIAPVAVTLRKYAAFCFDGKKTAKSSSADTRGTAMLREGTQLANTTADVM
jgi:hypothetical protein